MMHSIYRKFTFALYSILRSNGLFLLTAKPWPVLTVSPSWLSPGASVTLSCQVEHPSAGWRFYWYKAVPDLSEELSSYSYELLPDTNWTADASTIIHGQTHTAGYMCRAGRVDREYYTDYSHTEFVWSGGQFVLLLFLFINSDFFCWCLKPSVSLCMFKVSEQ